MPGSGPVEEKGRVGIGFEYGGEGTKWVCEEDLPEEEEEVRIDCGYRRVLEMVMEIN